MMCQKHRKAWKTVGTRLYRVRDSSTPGHYPINGGRDTIGSLPFSAYFRHERRACVIFSEIVGVNARKRGPYAGYPMVGRGKGPIDRARYAFFNAVAAEFSTACAVASGVALPAKSAWVELTAT